MTKEIDEFFDNLLNVEIKKESVCMKEIVEIFVTSTVYSIQSEEEIPRFNIIFSKEALNFFGKIAKNPFIKEGSFTPNIREKDIQNLYLENQKDPNYPTVFIKDHKFFFETLTNIINEQINLNYDYGETMSARMVAIRLMKRIWLRMGVDDFEDVESFLQKQLDFLKNFEFDKPNEEIYYNTIDSNKITYEVEKSETWCESTRRIHFKIYNSTNYHDLPKIYYDIREEGNEKVCYISAVQMPNNRHRINSIERKLYKLNKGIEENLVHPNFIMAMNLFYEILLSHNITRIKVPTLQILSYPYHVILSNQVKNKFEKYWNKETLEYMEFLKSARTVWAEKEYKNLLEIYEHDKNWYNHVVKKEDFISKSKTEGLINLFIQMTYIDDCSQINSVPFVESSYLDISLVDKKNKIYKKVK